MKDSVVFVTKLLLSLVVVAILFGIYAGFKLLGLA